VALLTGFLGAGKSTCLNHYLRSPAAANTAVLVNEFGEIDIDGTVLASALDDGSRVIPLPNGCICCTVQDDLAEALINLANQRENNPGAISRCVIETTGVADPGAIVSGAAHDPRLKQLIRVDQTVTVCAANGLSNRLERFPEVAKQIGLADKVLITKADLASTEEIAIAEQVIASINPLADVCITKGGSENPDSLFEIQSNTTPANTPQATVDRALSVTPTHHSHSINTFSIHLPNPIDSDRFRDTMSFLIMRHAEKLLRVKGIVRFYGEEHPQLVNGVHDVISCTPAPADSISDNTSGGSLVFIGVDLPEESVIADIRSC